MSDATRPDGRSVREFAPKVRWGRRLFKAFFLLLLAAIAAHWGWGKYAQSHFEDELQRHRAAGERINLANFIQPAPPDNQNAAIDLIAAAQALDTSDDIWQKFRCIKSGSPLDEIDHAIIAKALHQSRETLRRVDLAMTKPFIHWKQPGQVPAFFTHAPWMPLTRNFDDLLQLAALRAHQLGDDRQSIYRIRQLLFLARAIDQAPLLYAHRSAMTLRSIASTTLLRITPELKAGVGTDGQLSTASLQSLIVELLDDESSRQTLVLSLQVERFETHLRIESRLQGRAGFSRFSSDDIFTQLIDHALKPITLQDAPILFDYATHVLDVVQDERQWPDVKRRTRSFTALDELRESPDLHRAALSSMMDYYQPLQSHFRTLTEQHLAATVLAIRLYTADHAGQLPAELEDLVPAYLPALPTDPMSNGASKLRYDPNPASPILYSVGDDARDDGGSNESTQGWHRPANDYPIDWLLRDVVIPLAVDSPITRK